MPESRLQRTRESYRSGWDTSGLVASGPVELEGRYLVNPDPHEISRKGAGVWPSLACLGVLCVGAVIMTNHPLASIPFVLAAFAGQFCVNRYYTGSWW